MSSGAVPAATIPDPISVTWSSILAATTVGDIGAGCPPGTVQVWDVVRDEGGPERDTVAALLRLLPDADASTPLVVMLSSASGRQVPSQRGFHQWSWAARGAHVLSLSDPMLLRADTSVSTGWFLQDFLRPRPMIPALIARLCALLSTCTCLVLGSSAGGYAMVRLLPLLCPLVHPATQVVGCAVNNQFDLSRYYQRDDRRRCTDAGLRNHH